MTCTHDYFGRTPRAFKACPSCLIQERDALALEVNRERARADEAEKRVVELERAIVGHWKPLAEKVSADRIAAALLISEGRDRAEAAEKRAEGLEAELMGQRAECLDVLDAAIESEEGRIAAEALLENLASASSSLCDCVEDGARSSVSREYLAPVRALLSKLDARVIGTLMRCRHGTDRLELCWKCCAEAGVCTYESRGELCHCRKCLTARGVGT